MPSNPPPPRLYGGNTEGLSAQRRIELLRELLTTYRDVAETFRTGERCSAEAAWGLKMPQLYNAGSYRKLDGYLCALHSLLPVAWWHLTERYLRSTRRLTIASKSKKSKSGWKIAANEAVLSERLIPTGAVPRYWVIIERWNPKVDLRKVDDALAVLERAWKGPIRLPEAFTGVEEKAA